MGSKYIENKPELNQLATLSRLGSAKEQSKSRLSSLHNSFRNNTKHSHPKHL